MRDLQSINKVYRVLKFKQNSRKSTHYSRRPYTSIALISLQIYREELNFTAGDRVHHSRRYRWSPAWIENPGCLILSVYRLEVRIVENGYVLVYCNGPCSVLPSKQDRAPGRQLRSQAHHHLYLWLEIPSLLVYCLYSSHNIVHSAKCIVHSALYIVHSALCIVHCA